MVDSSSCPPSVLLSLLPEASIYCIDNYDAEKYAEMFLGEFENPEIIWNTEMRQHMMEKLALHIADFTTRLPSNVKASYQFCPIPLIQYPQLESEIFCHIYYLRHLCNVTKFPDWPINQPVEFLKCCLITLKAELDRKGCSMSVEAACQVLHLKSEMLQYFF
ncbi:unnamed protein product [Soboliphyme baturini]|uniref:NR LBD domain-containing protein n=1 Tax=Soboliphyme baturini TaxID=241478 RepID=A0A183IRQ6_9BILA|nr:unnamed protein product [Soboliphyme baturini]